MVENWAPCTMAFTRKALISIASLGAKAPELTLAFDSSAKVLTSLFTSLPFWSWSCSCTSPFQESMVGFKSCSSRLPSERVCRLAWTITVSCMSTDSAPRLSLTIARNTMVPEGERMLNDGAVPHSNQTSSTSFCDSRMKPNLYSSGGSSESAQLLHCILKTSSTATPSFTQGQPSVPTSHDSSLHAWHASPLGGSFRTSSSTALPMEPFTLHESSTLYCDAVRIPESGDTLNVGWLYPKGIHKPDPTSGGLNTHCNSPPAELHSPFSTSPFLAFIFTEASDLTKPMSVEIETEGIGSASKKTGIVNVWGVFRPLRTVSLK
mmetsp:Transcript_7845/g.15568  ORF Transcript_7845/g.15568 Transcript_7845/m.15568 type:complete len:321 (+) Transcript_7845:2657-3619(+)